jgi:hypothetical protein
MGTLPLEGRDGVGVQACQRGERLQWRKWLPQNPHPGPPLKGEGAVLWLPGDRDDVVRYPHHFALGSRTR